MKRTALARRTPLRRGGRIGTRRAGQRRRSDAPRDPAYLAWVRSQPCCVCRARDLVDPHHAGRRPGGSMKATDRTAIPLCRCCHDDWHAARGFAAGLDRDQRRAWADLQIAATQRLYYALTGIDVHEAATAA